MGLGDREEDTVSPPEAAEVPGDSAGPFPIQNRTKRPLCKLQQDGCGLDFMCNFQMFSLSAVEKGYLGGGQGFLSALLTGGCGMSVRVCVSSRTNEHPKLVSRYCYELWLYRMGRALAGVGCDGVLSWCLGEVLPERASSGEFMEKDGWMADPVPAPQTEEVVPAASKMLDRVEGSGTALSSHPKCAGTKVCPLTSASWSTG